MNIDEEKSKSFGNGFSLALVIMSFCSFMFIANMNLSYENVSKDIEAYKEKCGQMGSTLHSFDLGGEFICQKDEGFISVTM